jgi:putative flippase GtrA
MAPIAYIWSLRKQFLRYSVVGFSGVFLDIGTLILFKEVFFLTATVAVLVNQSIVMAYNFTLNKYWSFSSKAMPHKQIVRYLTLAAWNYIFSVSSMYFLHELLGYDYRIVRILTIMVAVSWNFLLFKYWVYKEDVKIGDE